MLLLLLVVRLLQEVLLLLLGDIRHLVLGRDVMVLVGLLLLGLCWVLRFEVFLLWSLAAVELAAAAVAVV